MSKVIVSNWGQVWKSLAVWFPFLVSAIYVFVQDSMSAGVIPDKYLPVFIIISSVLGWVIKQKGIKK